MNLLEPFIATHSAASTATETNTYGQNNGDEHHTADHDADNGGDGQSYCWTIFFIAVIPTVVVGIAKHVVLHTFPVATFELIVLAMT